MCRRTRCWRSGRDRVAIEELPRRRRAARRRSSSCRGCQAFVGEPLPPWPQLSLMVVPRERAGLNRGVPASRAEHMARRSDQRGQGPRPGPVPRAPRGLLHPRAVVEGEEAENDSGGASIAPRARPRMRVAARGPLAHAPVAPSTCTRCRRPSAAAAQPSDSRALPSLASQARGCSPCACSHRRARLAAGRHTRAESGLGVGSCPRPVSYTHLTLPPKA